MKKKIEHFYFTIQGWFNYADVYDMALSWFGDGAHFMEVGSWKGRSTAYMATNIHNSGKRIKFDCVDTWKGSWEHHMSDEDLKRHYPDEGSRWQMKNLNMKDLFGQFTRNIKPVRHVVTPFKMESVEAAKLYKDKSLDFILLDAAHDEESVYQDLCAWTPKLKDTGVIAGDDFVQEGVRLGVKKYAAEHGDFEMFFGANIMCPWIRVNEQTQQQHWRTPLI